MYILFYIYRVQHVCVMIRQACVRYTLLLILLLLLLSRTCYLSWFWDPERISSTARRFARNKIFIFLNYYDIPNNNNILHSVLFIIIMYPYSILYNIIYLYVCECVSVCVWWERVAESKSRLTRARYRYVIFLWIFNKLLLRRHCYRLLFVCLELNKT